MSSVLREVIMKQEVRMKTRIMVTGIIFMALALPSAAKDLMTREECQDKTAVFAALKDSYGQKRVWTEQEFKFKKPSDSWLDGHRPPYEVKMRLLKPGDTTAYVDIVGIDVSTGKKDSATVGTIPNK